MFYITFSYTSYKIFVKYYTSYDSMVTTSYSTKTANAGTSSFAMMSDDSYLERSGYSIGSIDYYVVAVYILDSLGGLILRQVMTRATRQKIM